MKTPMENTEKDLLKLFRNNPEAIEKLNKVSRFPLEKESTIIFREESIKDFNKKKKTEDTPNNKGAASFLLK